METPTPIEVRRILEERARVLSVAPEREDVGERVQVVPLIIDGETYGVDASQVQEIQPLRGLVPVPSTPEFVAGVMNIRGTIYSVVHLRRFLGLPDAENGNPAKVALVSAAGLTIGVLADEVSDVRSVPLQDIDPAPATTAGVREEYVRGVTPDMVLILDLNAVLGDRRMIVSADDAG